MSAHQYIESYDLPRDLGIYLSGYDHDSYWKLMRELIVAGHDPENVILMEIDPEHQKTLPDFLVTQRELGIAIVDILSLKKRGKKLFYREGRARDRSPAHLQPLHCGRTRAQEHHAAFRSAR